MTEAKDLSPEAKTMLGTIPAAASESVVGTKSQWRPVSERPELDKQPMRQFVLIDGTRHHSGMAWGRKHWGLAYIRKPGSDDETQQYRRSDIEQILKDGDMDYGDVTHWMPATCPRFPAEH